jgi:hypothetical protein
MTCNGETEAVHRLPAMEELLPPPLAGDSPGGASAPRGHYHHSTYAPQISLKFLALSSS